MRPKRQGQTRLNVTKEYSSAQREVAHQFGVDHPITNEVFIPFNLSLIRLSSQDAESDSKDITPKPRGPDDYKTSFIHLKKSVQVVPSNHAPSEVISDMYRPICIHNLKYFFE